MKGGGGVKANEQKNPNVVVVLKMDLHCGGCEAKIVKFLKRFPGSAHTAFSVFCLFFVFSG